MARPRAYQERLEALSQGAAWQRGKLENAAEPIDLGGLLPVVPRLARTLAGDVASGAWQPLPARLGVARLDKDRLLHRFEPLDLVVHGVVAAALADVLLPKLSRSVWSYQRGRSALLAVRSLAAFLRQHRAARPDPRRRGLFVLRRDVASFGDSVRLDGRAPLWAQLEALLGDPRRDADAERALALLEQVVRPPVRGDDGAPCQRLLGLPTGSPINPVLTNLNLMPLDAALDGAPDAFYARYGDDLVFAHADPAVSLAASRRIDGVLASLGLRPHPTKRRDLWWNGAGRPSPADGFESTRELRFLGASVSFAANITLPADKAAELFAALEPRLRTSALLSRAEPEAGVADGELRLLCSIAAEGLDPGSPFALPHAAELRAVVDDRGQLRDLDLRLARLVAKVATGARSVRALRSVPPSRLRALGLPGLVAARLPARGAG